MSSRRFGHFAGERRRRRDVEFAAVSMGLPDQVLVLVLVVGHDVDWWIGVAQSAGPEIFLSRHVAVAGRTTDRRHQWRAAGFAEVIEDAHDHGALGDEGDDLHVAAAAPAAQRIDLVNARDQSCPRAGTA